MGSSLHSRETKAHELDLQMLYVVLKNPPIECKPIHIETAIEITKRGLSIANAGTYQNQNEQHQNSINHKHSSSCTRLITRPIRGNSSTKAFELFINSQHREWRHFNNSEK